jgi:hypothetical protein
VRGGSDMDSRVTATPRLPCPALSPGPLKETQRHCSPPPQAACYPAHPARRSFIGQNTDTSPPSGYPAFTRQQRD